MVVAPLSALRCVLRCWCYVKAPGFNSTRFFKAALLEIPMLTPLGVHGDNVVECTRTRDAIALALGLDPSAWQKVTGPIWSPTFHYSTKDDTAFAVKLYPGHDRHGGSFAPFVETKDGPALGEHPDCYVTRDADGQVILAIEYCGALPAGNNAWQRSGRAWALGKLGVPYIFLAELAGHELEKSGKIKAPRNPSLVVPGSFLTFGASTPAICTVLYLSAASASTADAKAIVGLGGTAAFHHLLREAVETGEISATARAQASAHQVAAIKWLYEKGRKKASLSAEGWQNYASSVAEGQPAAAHWLALGKGQAKKISRSKWPAGALSVVDWMAKVAVQAGGDFPGCILPASARPNLAVLLESQFGQESGDANFWALIKDTTKPLGVALLAGFKPEGEDSRPDRGVIPLFRMLVPDDSCDLLTLVYGPAPSAQQALVGKDVGALAKQNGLWRTAVNLGQAIGFIGRSSMRALRRFVAPLAIDRAKTVNQVIAPPQTIDFNEHDIDSLLHFLMESCAWPDGHEALCNPPGGDWSGVTMIADGDGRKRFRWSSLPRAPEGKKRPDHIFQTQTALLAIESKGLATQIPAAIGAPLQRYVHDLLARPATAASGDGGITWALHARQTGPVPGKEKILTGIAFEWRPGDDLEGLRAQAQTDIAIGVSFDRSTGTAAVRMTGPQSSAYKDRWRKVARGRLFGLVTFP